MCKGTNPSEIPDIKFNTSPPLVVQADIVYAIRRSISATLVTDWAGIPQPQDLSKHSPPIK